MGNLPVTNESPGTGLASMAGDTGLGAREGRVEPADKLILDPPGSFLQTPVFLNIEAFFLWMEESFQSSKPRVLNDSFNSFNKYRFTLMRMVKM